MKKVTLPKFVIIVCAIFLVGISFFFGYKCKESLKEEEPICKNTIEYVEKCDNPVVEEKFTVGENKYKITTYEKFITMQNDGGSHTNSYYEIDLTKNKVTMKEDKYVGFKGYEYEGKIRFEKVLSLEESTKLKELIEEIISHKDEEIKDKEYEYYTLETKEYEEIRIIDEKIISKLNNLLEKED